MTDAVCGALRRRKSLSSLEDPVSARAGSARLGRVLGCGDLTALGVGSTLGVGVFVLAGHVARDIAGPSVVLSFAIAALASLFAGLCYAEFGGREPRAGSAYAYSYVCSGELAAFVIGWNLILEYVIGSASVARGVSLYLDEMLGGVMGKAFKEVAPLGPSFLAGHVDFLAFVIAMLFAVALAFGMKKSTLVNNILSLLNVAVVAFVIIAGCININIDNWRVDPSKISDGSSVGAGGFFPFGVLGTIRGAATCFYGFVGFDCIATTGEEVREPRKAIPRAILASLAVIFLSYFGVSAVLTLMLPYYKQDRDAPLPHAFEEIGWTFAKWIVAVGGMIGLLTSLFGAMFPLPRILYAMASDGLIFRLLGNVSSRFNTPVIGTLLAGLLTGLMASLFDLHQLVNMMSIGTLMAYTMVAACVLLIRYEDIDKSTSSQNGKDGEDIPLLKKDQATDTKHEMDSPRGIEYEASEYESRLEENLQPQERTTLVSSTPHHKPSTKEIFGQIINSQRLKTPTTLSGQVVSWLILAYALSCLALGLCLVYTQTALSVAEAWAIWLCGILAILVLSILLSIALQPTTSKPLTFSVPFVPLIPAVSIFINIYLMLMLDYTTWIRFGVWMAVGVIVFLITRCVGKKSHQVTWITVTGSSNKKLPMRSDPMPNVILPYNINYAYENCIELETSGEFKSTNPNNNGIIRSVSEDDSVVSVLPDVVIPAKATVVESEVLENKETLETSFGADEVTIKIGDEPSKSEQTPEPAETVLAYLDDMLQVEEMIAQTEEPCSTSKSLSDSQEDTSPNTHKTSSSSLSQNSLDKNSPIGTPIVDHNVPNASSEISASVLSNSLPVVSSVDKTEEFKLAVKESEEFIKSPDIEKKDVDTKDELCKNERSNDTSVVLRDSKSAPNIVGNDEKMKDVFGGKISGFVSVRNSIFAQKLDKILSGKPEDSLFTLRAKRNQKETLKHTSLDLRFLPNTMSVHKPDDGKEFSIPEPPKMPPPDIFRRMHSTPASFTKRRNSMSNLFEPLSTNKETIPDKNEQNKEEVQLQMADITEQADSKTDVLKTNSEFENKKGDFEIDLPETAEKTQMINQKNSAEIGVNGSDPACKTEKPSLVVIVPYSQTTKEQSKVKNSEKVEEENVRLKEIGNDSDDDESNVMTREELKIKLNSILASRLSIDAKASESVDEQSLHGDTDTEEILNEYTEDEAKIECPPENIPIHKDSQVAKKSSSENDTHVAKEDLS